MSREPVFPEQGRNYVASQSTGYCSRRSVEKTLRFFASASFLQDGLMVESCHVRWVYLAVWKKHREMRGNAKILSRLYLTLPEAYCIDRELACAKQLKGTRSGYRPGYNLIEEFGSESSTFPSINQRIDEQRRNCRWAPEFPIKRNRWRGIKKAALAGLSRSRHWDLLAPTNVTDHRR